MRLSSLVLRNPLSRAALLSLGLHALGLTALAFTLVPGQSVRQWLEVDRAHFAGEPIVLEARIASASLELPPLPEIPPAESPVLVTPAVARMEHHVYVDRTATETAPILPLLVKPEPAKREITPDNPAAPIRPVETASEPPRVAAARTVARAQREVVPTTLGTSLRKSARMFDNRPPRYPELAQRNRWEGTVLLRLFIDSQGRVTKVEVARSSGHALLDAEAASAVRIWRGAPAMLDGVAVASEEFLPVRFRLD